ncbi:MAG: DUF924 family protein [Kiloniellales bacterium]
MTQVAEILDFWFALEAEARWFETDAAFDQEIGERFRADYERAAGGGLADWQSSPEGVLALILLLDQFPRNMFRGTARAFATDDAAAEVAERAIADGFDHGLSAAQCRFLYMPFQHSESLARQRRSVELFRRLNLPKSLDYAERHLRVIERFGRFPHRNKTLGRTSTPEEEAFLAGPNAPY